MKKAYCRNTDCPLYNDEYEDNCARDEDNTTECEDAQWSDEDEE